MTLSRIFLLTVFCCSTTFFYGQKSKPNEEYRAFDQNWKSIANINKATYFTRTKKINDTCWLVNSYNLQGPMISKEVYKDKETKIAHGTWIFYNAGGTIDSICPFRENLAHGTWYYLNDTGRYYLRKDYENGRLKAVRDLIREDDSLRAAGKGPELQDGEESVFPGAANAWGKYLNKNLVYPERALLAKKDGMVVVQFIVNKEGDIEDIDIYRSVEFSLDEESVRMIAKSPRWTPAVLDGKKVKSYKRQPIVYRLPR